MEYSGLHLLSKFSDCVLEHHICSYCGLMSLREQEANANEESPIISERPCDVHLLRDSFL